MNTVATNLLRVLLVVLLLASVPVQVVVPALATRVGTTFPEVAYLIVPYSAAAILFIACGQVALLATWPLLSLADRGGIVARPALRWLDVITACGAVAAALTTAVLLHMLGFVPGGGGPAIYYLAAVLAAGLAFVLIIVVMRRALESAIAGRATLGRSA